MKTSTLRTRARSTWHDLDIRTRMVHPDTARALAHRRASLPESLDTAEQYLGRHTVGCEGTQGVFPACDFTCSPCYHSSDANKVRVDGEHTVREVTAQMGLLRRLHGERGHAQLIGGEVSLLDPEDHAAALLAMRAAGREPMSMTHGDFGPQYLQDLVTDDTGALRLPRVSFAAHFDSLMRGRRGVPRPRRESDLHEHRRAFVAMFEDLRRRAGVRSYLAHNMTVTPENLDQVADVVAEVSAMGYQMMSFQPAASVGDDRRWSPGMETVSIDDVWERIEWGLGQPVPWKAMQFGHPACNRTAYGAVVGGTWVPLLDPDCAQDLRVRDAELRWFGGMTLQGIPPLLVAAKLARAVVRHPAAIPLAGGWLVRFVRRAGGPRQVVAALGSRRVRPLTFVVHSFMDASVVSPAWEATLAGKGAEQPEVREAQDRLAGCFYVMAHPESGELVPACVQHSVLDPEQNRRLRVLLPMPTVRRRRPDSAQPKPSAQVAR